MYSTKSRSKLYGILLAISLVSGLSLLSSGTVQAQNVWRQNQDRDWNRDRDRRDHDRDRDRDRDHDRERGNGRYGRGRLGRYGQRGNGGYRNGGYGNYGYNIYQVAQQRGYQDGLNTGASDAQRGQSYNPQRSHFYRDASYGYDSSYGNREQYRAVYRQGFLQGYRQGFQQYGGYNRNGVYNRRWPW